MLLFPCYLLLKAWIYTIKAVTHICVCVCVLLVLSALSCDVMWSLISSSPTGMTWNCWICGWFWCLWTVLWWWCICMIWSVWLDGSCVVTNRLRIWPFSGVFFISLMSSSTEASTKIRNDAVVLLQFCWLRQICVRTDWKVSGSRETLDERWRLSQTIASLLKTSVRTQNWSQWDIEYWKITQTWSKAEGITLIRKVNWTTKTWF